MDIDINAIKGIIENGVIEKKDIWQNLLQILSNENSELGHYFFRNGDFDTNSLVGKIQNKADLPDDAFTNLLDSLSSKPFWNESMSSALSYFLKHFKISDKTESIPGIAAVTYEDVYNADAGATFDPLTKFVIPWKNIDDKDYKTVRSGDEIDAVIASDDNLQFTHKGDKNWIRLIMPEYERFVEIEDLDRNFWVIGQVISAISAYLFDDDGPMKNLLSNIMQELVELWENILYLWAALALYDNRKYTDVHVEAVYVPNDELQSQFKYDNFSGITSWSDICNRFAHKIQDYPESNLIIIPIRRRDNYEHNYYRTERYPGILFYDRNNPLDNDLTKGFRILAFQKEVSGKRVDTGDVEVADFENSVYAAKDNENGTLDVIFPYANAKIKTEFVPSLYYGAIRTIIDFPSTSWSYDVEQGFTFKSFSLTCYDAIAEAISGEQVKVGKRTLERNIVINTATPAKTGDGDDQRILAELTLKPETGISGKTTDGVKLKKGYYLGELASDSVLTKEVSYKIKDRTVKMPPIASNNLYSSQTGTPQYKVFYYDICQVKSEIQRENGAILQKYYNLVFNNSSNRNIALIVGTRQFDIYKSGFTDSWKYDGSYTKEDMKQDTMEATSYSGLGGYYKLNNSGTSLIKRNDINTSTTTYYDENNTFVSGSGIDSLDYKNKNDYLLPFYGYAKITGVNTSSTDDYGFTSFIHSKNGYSYNNINDLEQGFKNNDIKFTGSHGGRIDLGAILIIPGIDEIYTYDLYENYKVLPNIQIDSTLDGAHTIWLQGETSKPTRHVWNDTTTLIFRDKDADKFTADNWCIAFLKTYGIYAPTGQLDRVDKVSGAEVLSGYLDGNSSTGTSSNNIKPMVFKTYVHIFKPNAKYSSYERSYWQLPANYFNSRPTGDADNFVWNNTPSINVQSNEGYLTEQQFLNKYDDLLKTTNTGIGTISGNYKLISWESDYTTYTSTILSNKYNFYAKPHTGR